MSIWWLPRQVVKGNSVKFMPGAGPPMPDRCPETGSGYLMGGPFWAEPIHDPAWLQGVLAAVKASQATSEPTLQIAHCRDEYNRWRGLHICTSSIGLMRLLAAYRWLDTILHGRMLDVVNFMHMSVPAAHLASLRVLCLTRTDV